MVQLKSSSSTTDSDTAVAPSVEDIPPPPPTATTGTITPTPGTIGYGMSSQCSTLTWSSNGYVVDISGYGLVRQPGVADITEPQVCPKETTEYKITAIGSGGTSDNTATVTVIQPPPPVIEASQETVEKKDEVTGETAGYVTFYSVGGVLECACSTGPDQATDP
ncbi:MAG: hypothetical protein E4H15_07990, partial [Syntrophobacterales bacterium]